MIETRNLAATREKGKKPAISGLDLQVGKGESCAQLDPRGKRELADLLNSFKQTKIISTHDMQFARSVCNTAIVLDRGKLAARGNIDEILSDAPLLERCSLL